ncbi:PHD finger protein 7-like [Aegotheles albertisi]
MPASEEQACMFCGQAKDEQETCGNRVVKHDVCAHAFCLLFASGLFEKMSEIQGLPAVRIKDLRSAILGAAEEHCFVCGQSGAGISCRELGCGRRFHLPCAREGHCVTQYFPPYRAFCGEHSPRQAVEAAPEEDTTCLICLELVGDQKSYGTLVCPACQHAWFHRGCIQGLAVGEGSTRFQCPLCREKELFGLEMRTMGIQVPRSLPAFDSQAFAELNARHSRCDARECLCPRGREQAQAQGSSELESGGRSSTPGPVRVHERSRGRRRTRNPYSRPK